MTQPQALVTERALVRRLNRKLAREGLHVKTCRWGTRGFHDLGRHFVVNTRLRAIDKKHIDLESCGRQLGCLADSEVLSIEEVTQ